MISELQIQTTTRCLLALAAVLILASLAFGAGAPGAAAATGKCKRVNASLTDVSKKKVVRATECLIAKARAKAGEHSLRRKSSVAGVSRRHAKTMVKQNCFRHVCKGEGGIQTRLKRAGYLDGSSSYGFGENTGCATSAKAMVNAWLGSNFHRSNMLGKKFRHIGIGVVNHAPKVQSACAGRGYMTFSVLFTWRKR